MPRCLDLVKVGFWKLIILFVIWQLWRVTVAADYTHSATTAVVWHYLSFRLEQFSLLSYEFPLPFLPAPFHSIFLSSSSSISSATGVRPAACGDASGGTGGIDELVSQHYALCRIYIQYWLILNYASAKRQIVLYTSLTWQLYASMYALKIIFMNLSIGPSWTMAGSVYFSVINIMHQFIVSVWLSHVILGCFPCIEAMHRSSLPAGVQEEAILPFTQTPTNRSSSSVVRNSHLAEGRVDNCFGLNNVKYADNLVFP